MREIEDEWSQAAGFELIDVNTGINLLEEYEAFDISYVREKFSAASQPITIKLGKAITRRRRFFEFKKRHAQKIRRNPTNSSKGKTTDEEYEVEDTSSLASNDSISSAFMHRMPMSLEPKFGMIVCPYCSAILKFDTRTSWRYVAISLL